MKLSTASYGPKTDISEEDLVRAFQEYSDDDEFIILSQADQTYIQAAGEGNGPYFLEYRDGDEDHHFQCVEELSKNDVKSAFLKYLKGDVSWKTDYEWEQLEQLKNEPWWKFW